MDTHTRPTGSVCIKHGWGMIRHIGWVLLAFITFKSLKISGVEVDAEFLDELSEVDDEL